MHGTVYVLVYDKQLQLFHVPRALCIQLIMPRLLCTVISHIDFPVIARKVPWKSCLFSKRRPMTFALFFAVMFGIQCQLQRICVCSVFVYIMKWMFRASRGSASELHNRTFSCCILASDSSTLAQLRLCFCLLQNKRKSRVFASWETETESKWKSFKLWNIFVYLCVHRIIQHLK